jgi:hypothetical protein
MLGIMWMLSLSYNKMQYLKFRTSNCQTIQLDNSYNNGYIINGINTRFFYIAVESSLSWKHHVDSLMVKLSRTCYAVRALRPFVPNESLQMI